MENFYFSARSWDMVDCIVLALGALVLFGLLFTGGGAPPVGLLFRRTHSCGWFTSQSGALRFFGLLPGPGNKNPRPISR